MKPPALNPRPVLVIAVAAVSCAAILVRFTAAAPAIVAFYRLLFSCLLLLPLLAKERQVSQLSRADLRWCCLGGAFLALHFVFWFTSLGLTTVSSSTLLVNIHPLVVIGAGWLWLGEKTQPATLPGVLLALAGMVLLGWGDLHLGGTALIGDLYAAGGGLMIAGYYLIGRRVRPRVGVALYSLLVYGTSTLLLLAYNIAVANPLAGYTPQDWLIFAALALIPTIFGHTLLNWALKYLSAGAVSVSVLGEPVLATLLALLILGEIPGPVQMIGAIMVLSGIWLFLRITTGTGRKN